MALAGVGVVRGSGGGGGLGVGGVVSARSGCWGGLLGVGLKMVGSRGVGV